MRINLGLALDLGQRGRLDQTLRDYTPLLQRAEQQGFATLFAGESYSTQQPAAHLPTPLLALAALAPATSTLRLGTGVTLVPTWQPLRLAYEAAVLDQISGGRVILGVGAGSPSNWKRWGIPPEGMGQRLDETLAALKALWSGEQGFHGRYVQIEGGIAPRPLQPGGPQIWVGGTANAAVRRAALYGDAWYGATQYRFEVIASLIARYRAELAEQGKDPAGAIVSINRLAYVDDTDELAMQRGWPAVRKVLESYISYGALQDAPDLREAVTLVGSPETVARQLERYADIGVTHVQLRAAPADLPLDVVEASVARIGEKVLPRFRQQLPDGP